MSTLSDENKFVYGGYLRVKSVIRSKRLVNQTPLCLFYLGKVGILVGDAHDLVLAKLVVLKFHPALLNCINCMIAAHLDVLSAPNLSASLPNDNVPRQNCLPAELFHAKALSGRVPAVFRAAAGLFGRITYLLP